MSPPRGARGLHPDTVLVHGPRTPQPYRATLPPVVLSTAFEHPSAEDMEAVFAHGQDGYAYSRLSNPTVAALEERITAISEARGTVALASGMSAVALALLALVRSGDHLVAGKHIFGGSYTLLNETFSRLGIRTSWVDARNGDDVRRAITPQTRAVLVEAIANPAMAVPDFDAIRKHCNAAHIPLLVDATLVTPLWLDAEATGADVALYSSSKYLAGAATTIGGLIVDTGRFPWGEQGPVELGEYQRHGAQGYLNRIRRELLVGMGPTLSPQTAFLLIVGLETLGLRLERQWSTACRIAAWLQCQPGVSRVLYPGLPHDPDHERCRRYFRGRCGSVLSFTLSSKDACFRFLNALGLIQRAANLGDTRSLALHPASTIYYGFWPAQKDELGVPDTLIRLSVGIEDAEDLSADLAQALAAASLPRP
jgi:O-acetylhomoserine (thiol)-lyase